MLDIINNSTVIPAVQKACFFGAGALIGRKVIMAGVSKTAAKISEVTGHENAHEWNVTANQYLIQAKKDAARDLTLATSLVGLGLAAGLGQSVTEQTSNYELFLKQVIKTIEDIPLPVKIGFDGLNLASVLLSGPRSWDMPKLRGLNIAYFVTKYYLGIAKLNFEVRKSLTPKH